MGGNPVKSWGRGRMWYLQWSCILSKGSGNTPVVVFISIRSSCVDNLACKRDLHFFYHQMCSGCVVTFLKRWGFQTWQSFYVSLLGPLHLEWTLIYRRPFNVPGNKNISFSSSKLVLAVKLDVQEQDVYTQDQKWSPHSKGLFTEYTTLEILQLVKARRSWYEMTSTFSRNNIHFSKKKFVPHLNLKRIGFQK